MAGGSFGAGTGTWVSPIEIEDVLDLDAIRYQTEPAYYRLIGNLNLTGFDWLPIMGPDNGPTPCLGIRGYNFTISNLTISDTTAGYEYGGWNSGFGLFGVANDFRVESLTLQHVTINCTQNLAVGALIGRANGLCRIYNTTVSNATITVENSATVGGISGYLNQFTSLYGNKVHGSTLNIGDGAGRYIGGVFGEAFGSEPEDAGFNPFYGNMSENVNIIFADCEGGVYTAAEYVGGVVGYLYVQDPACRVRNSRAKNISITLGGGSGSPYHQTVGGFAGMLTGPNGYSVMNCYASGEIKVSAAVVADPASYDVWNVGGFSPYWYGGPNSVMSACIADVTITLPYDPADPTNVMTVAGFLGVHWNDSVIEDCYSLGDVHGGGSIVGGFVGDLDSGPHNDPRIRRCYSRGAVTGVPHPEEPEQNGWVNGFAGAIMLTRTTYHGVRWSYNQIVSCYYDITDCPIPGPTDGLAEWGPQFGVPASSTDLKEGVEGPPYIPSVSTKQIFIKTHPTEVHAITWPTNVTWLPGYAPPEGPLDLDSEHMLEIEHIMFADYTERFLGKYFNLTGSE